MYKQLRNQKIPRYLEETERDIERDEWLEEVIECLPDIKEVKI